MEFGIGGTGSHHRSQPDTLRHAFRVDSITARRLALPACSCHRPDIKNTQSPLGLTQPVCPMECEDREELEIVDVTGYPSL